MAMNKFRQQFSGLELGWVDVVVGRSGLSTDEHSPCPVEDARFDQCPESQNGLSNDDPPAIPERFRQCATTRVLQVALTTPEPMATPLSLLAW